MRRKRKKKREGKVKKNENVILAKWRTQVKNRCERKASVSRVGTLMCNEVKYVPISHVN